MQFKIHFGFFMTIYLKGKYVENCKVLFALSSLLSTKLNLWTRTKHRNMVQIMSCKYFPDCEAILSCISFHDWYFAGVFFCWLRVFFVYNSFSAQTMLIISFKRKNEKTNLLEIPQILRK